MQRRSNIVAPLPPAVSDEDKASARALIRRIAEHTDPGTARALAMFDAFLRRPEPSYADKKKERDQRIRWLRVQHYAHLTVRGAAAKMSTDAKAFARSSCNPLVEPSMSLHRISVLNGGEFPKPRTLQMVCKGF